MSNLDYINELGISEDLASNETDVAANEAIEESQEDLSLDSGDNTSESTDSSTEANSEDNPLLESLRGQIEGMEKRIADKDAYIQELRDSSKQKEEPEQQEVDTEEDFWDNPEQTIKSLKDELMEQRNTAKIQQMQIQEAIFANTVEGYWDTVNQETLQEAVATDPDFSKEFNSSKEPYKTAYEYLKTKAKTVNDSYEAEVERRVQERLKSAGVKEKREVPPNINGGGKSSSSKPSVSDDGFAAVFGSTY